MTVREMNHAARSGKYVIAFYVLDGEERTGRIMSARTRHGKIEVHCLNSGRWAAWLGDAWIA